MTTPPPEHDLRPETRLRQRAELIAIVEQDSATTPRRRFVPLVAAAAVVAIIAGLAIGLPALRRDNSEPAVSGDPQPLTTEPLTAGDKSKYGKICFSRSRLPMIKQREGYQVVDGFRFANAPANAFTTSWVVIKNTSLGLWTACGLNAQDMVIQSTTSGTDQPQYRAVETRMIGAGTYAAHVTRITVAVGNQSPVDAVLRHGFFFTAVPYVRVRGPHTDATPLPYTIHGYDATGTLVYSSPKNDGEWRAQGRTCYIDPNGKLVGWMSDNPHPDPSTCRRSFIWNYQPK
ncbi:hypothetical protein AB0H36_03295 [Kribbella sp. NPDC050820]|uniref:hypothetical protein n=1 Tax=Kribbella sp. NPDC050820 TaxID=3155408 RepID=UPI0033C07C90